MMRRKKPKKSAPGKKAGSIVAWAALRERLSKDAGFTTAALYALKKNEPRLVELFENIGKQVNLTTQAKRMLATELQYAAIDRQLHEMNAIAAKPADTITAIVPTRKGQAVVLISKKEGVWRMEIKEACK